MSGYSYLNMILVIFLITGCKCSSDGDLQSDASKTDAEGSSQSTQNPADQRSLMQGEQTAPVGTDVDSAKEAEKPALPLQRDQKSEKKKVVKVVKKADLPEYCKIQIQGDDTPKYSLKTIKIVRSCPKVRLTLQHTGVKARETGGHNVVIVENSRLEDLLEKAIVAGSINHYIPRNDGRVVAATNLIGGKRSTQVEFSPKHFVSGVDYIFIDTFPDHARTMRGKVVFE